MSSSAARAVDSSPTAAIVSESFVKRYFTGRNPMGESFQFETGPGQPNPLVQIVGLLPQAPLLLAKRVKAV